MGPPQKTGLVGRPVPAGKETEGGDAAGGGRNSRTSWGWQFGACLNHPPTTRLTRAAHAHLIHPAALSFVSYGVGLVRVRVPGMQVEYSHTQDPQMCGALRSEWTSGVLCAWALKGIVGVSLHR